MREFVTAFVTGRLAYETEISLDEVVSRGLALILLGVGAPLFLLLGLAVLVTSGRPIFYRGDRLGKDKTLFTMFRFRTLRVGAEREIGGTLYNSTMDHATPFGEWLRSTRLDELPQLFNILRGDMTFLGPRPERPKVYETQCMEIRGYERRFRVKPGLIGFAQVYTPHGTPKPVRTRIDNMLATKSRSEWERVGFIAYTGLVVVVVTCRKAMQSAATLVSPTRRKNARRRQMERICPERAMAILRPPKEAATDNNLLGMFPVIDINEKAFRIRMDRAMPELSIEDIELRIQLPSSGRDQARFRTARCRGTLLQTRAADEGVDYVVVYEPMSDTSDYTIQQYFLRNSIANVLAS